MGKSAKYYSQKVRRHLLCPKKDRDRLTAQALKELDIFSQENPGALYDDCVGSFGPPAEFARALLAELDPDILRRYRKRRKFLLCTAFSVVGGIGLLASIACPIFWGWKYEDSQNLNKHARHVIELKAPMTQEEVQEFMNNLSFDDPAEAGGD